MIQFAILIALTFGSAWPESLPSTERILNFPGEWTDSSAPSVDQFVIDLSLWICSKPLIGRIAVATYGTIVWFWTIAVLSSLFALVPVAMWIVLFTCFGTVFTVSWAITITLGCCMLVSWASTFLRPIWIRTVHLITTRALELNPETREVFNALNSKMSANLFEAARGGVIGDIYYVGRVFSAQQCKIGVEQDPALWFALMSAWAYCPVPVQGWSASALTLLVCSLYLSKKFYHVVRLWMSTWFWAFKMLLAFLFGVTVVSPQTLAAWFDMLTWFVSIAFYPVLVWWRGGFRAARAFIRLVFAILLLKIVNWMFRLYILMPRDAAKAKGFTPTKETWRSLWNNVIMDVSRTLDNIALPHFIRSLPTKFDAAAINETQRILESLGWPQSDVVRDDIMPDHPTNIEHFASSYVGTVPSVKQGIHRLRLEVAEELQNLAGLAPVYKRTEQYATEENELVSLSRYFESHEVELPELPISDIFVLVGDIFRDSKLTPFFKDFEALEEVVWAWTLLA